MPPLSSTPSSLTYATARRVEQPATLQVLIATAASIALMHTLIGVDHTLPFVALARARSWSLRKLWLVTSACGAGHVLSSIALGAIGLGIGSSLAQLEGAEGARGSLASWLLIAFGTAFMVRGAMRAWRGRPHAHAHTHADGTVHEHHHDHQQGEHRHVHVPAGADADVDPRSTAVWALFVIFVLGPCEPLIPLLMVPALAQDWTWVPLVVGTFGVVTIGTMLSVVTVAYLGVRRGRFVKLERYTEVLTGAVIVASGASVRLLGV